MHTKAGLKASGGIQIHLVEIVEIEDHPSLVCTIQNIKVRLQTHILFFVNFVAAAVKAKKEIISVHQKIVKSNFLFIGKR
jgi:CTP synthase (UTP-ammonia lyase)